MSGPDPTDDDPTLPPDLRALQRFGRVMDRAVRVPVVGVEVGVDALLGLVPGAGDAVGAVAGLWAVVAALRHRVPAPVLVRVVGNLLLDLGLGAVPVLGDLADLFFKANVRNVELVLRHRDGSRPPRNVWAMVAVVAVPGLALVAGTAALAVSVLALLWNGLAALWGGA